MHGSDLSHNFSGYVVGAHVLIYHFPLFIKLVRQIIHYREENQILLSNSNISPVKAHCCICILKVSNTARSNKAGDIIQRTNIIMTALRALD